MQKPAEMADLEKLSSKSFSDLNSRSLYNVAITKPDSMKALIWVSQQLANSGALPPGYAKNPGQLIIAMEMADRMGMPLPAVISGMPIVRGKMGMEGKFALTLIQQKVSTYQTHNYIESGQEGSDDWGMRFELVHKDGRKELGEIVTIKTAKNNGWWSKKDKAGYETSFWQKLPRMMLKYRCTSFFLNERYPFLKYGLNFTDEIIDMGEAVTVERSDVDERISRSMQKQESEVAEAEEIDVSHLGKDGELVHATTKINRQKKLDGPTDDELKELVDLAEQLGYMEPMLPEIFGSMLGKDVKKNGLTRRDYEMLTKKLIDEGNNG